MKFIELDLKIKIQLGKNPLFIRWYVIIKKFFPMQWLFTLVPDTNVICFSKVSKPYYKFHQSSITLLLDIRIILKMAFLEKRETIQLRLKNVFDRLESNDLNQCFGALMDLTSTISSECNLVPLFLQAGGIQNIIFQLKKGDRNLTAICLDILIHYPISPEQSRHVRISFKI